MRKAWSKNQRHTNNFKLDYIIKSRTSTGLVYSKDKITKFYVIVNGIWFKMRKTQEESESSAQKKRKIRLEIFRFFDIA
ncbi:MAG: hypothetical protein BGN96_12820 [Bacteroidales bacterium 45-6]|nr:MAG: hypothetical protein BGN96_12820 [Bacteroidales bacterium 45-6]